MVQNGAKTGLSQGQGPSVGWMSDPDASSDLSTLECRRSDAAADPGTSSPQASPCVLQDAHPTGASQDRPPTKSPMGELLGKYSALLPSSSPPSAVPKKFKSCNGLSAPRFSERTSHAGSPLRKLPTAGPSSGEDLSSDMDSLISETILPKSSSAPTLQLSKNTAPPVLDVLDIENCANVSFRSSYFVNRRVRRLMVQAVDGSCLECTGGESPNSNSRVKVFLRDSWQSTRVNRGDTIHVITSREDALQLAGETSIDVSHENGRLLILHPDTLVSCTSIAESLTCRRQVVLRSAVRSPSDLSIEIIVGSVQHELIQSALANKPFQFREDALLTKLRTIVKGYSTELSLINSSEEDVVARVKPVLPGFRQWACKFILGPPKVPSLVTSHRGSKQLDIKIKGSRYSEEELRSPHWGLVGKVDVTAEVVCGAITRLAALEIKTGKRTSSESHLAQASLYQILLSDRHPGNVHPWSLLYYTSTGETKYVNSLPIELRALIQRRNELSCYAPSTVSTSLPPLNASESVCGWCSRQHSCLLYNRDSENLGGTVKLYEKVQTKLSHEFKDFFAKWSRLIDLEDSYRSRLMGESRIHWWTRSGEDFAAEQSATSVRQVWPEFRVKEVRAEADHYVYTLKSIDANTAPPDLVAGDRAMVSTRQHMALVRGICDRVGADEVDVRVQEPWLLKSVTYRVDRDNFYTDSGLSRYNLVELLENDRLRELVVSQVRPQFSSLDERRLQSTIGWASNKVLSNSALKPAKQATIMNNLNSEQASAIDKVLRAKDYALILGMPGTGKTTTIAATVASLVKRGQTVLVSGYTNSAVDTIVLKLLAADVECLRIGDPAKLHEGVKSVSASPQEVQANCDQYLTCPVVACTSHLVNHRLFSLRPEFDYCIVDEASQINLPLCLGPLRLASKFVLVGDHYQLPPLVQCPAAREGGMSESLFKLLCEKWPESMISLTKQYRMCHDIMELSNQVIYNGRLVCGSSAVASQVLTLNPSWNGCAHGLEDLIDPHRAVVFLDTDPLSGGRGAVEERVANGIKNGVEAEIISRIVRELDSAGASPSKVAVISVYRLQLELLRSTLKSECEAGLDILTADQAQGREKECVIVSLVRTQRTGELLKDWRRLNVVLTRAKQKLILVGSARTMRAAEGVAAFMAYMTDQHWIRPLKTL